MVSGEAPRLVATGVLKRFGATQALAGVDLTVRRGEIHALLGANGSGKSTLIKILAGVEPADEGRFRIADEQLEARELSPAVAHDRGLRFVHQAESLFPPLRVVENLAAGSGFLCGHARRIQWRANRRRAQALLERFGVDADPDQPVGELAPATQRMIAIVRALQDRDDTRGVLVLDEPTATLAARDVRTLHDALRTCARDGWGILYVTHRLDELFGFIDRATVLRDGRVSGTVTATEISHEDLVALIAGATLEATAAERERSSAAAAVLEVDRLTAGPLRGISLALRAGEVVGLAGLASSGRSTLLRTLVGAVRAEAGEVRLDGATLRPGRFDRRLAYVPEDRARDAAFLSLTLGENLHAASLHRFWRGLRLRHGEQRRSSQELIRRFAIRADSAEAAFKTLSGGNQQKAILARWLSRAPRVLLLDEPTQGVDVAARREIHHLIRDAVAGGAAALVASSDFEELAALCDRVLVLKGGTIADEVRGANVEASRLEQLAYGAVAVA